MDKVAGMSGDKGSLSDLVIDVDSKSLNVYRNRVGREGSDTCVKTLVN